MTSRLWLAIALLRADMHTGLARCDPRAGSALRQIRGIVKSPGNSGCSGSDGGNRISLRRRQSRP